MRNNRLVYLFFLFILILSCAIVTQCSAADTRTENLPENIVSPEVSKDHSVTFRIFAPKASQVSVDWFNYMPSIAMKKNEYGVWAATVGPLKPGIYTYIITIDDVYTLDPRNPSIHRNIPNVSIVEVSGDTPSDWQLQTVPHGAIHTHWYNSGALGKQRRLHVYTPPGYSQGKTKYPVLYLLHGWGDDDSSWILTGRVNCILDNLISEGKVKPMIVVMPYGHTFNPRSEDGNQSMEQFLKDIQNDIINDVIPMVEKNYRVKKGQQNQAICGLSMGGWQSANIGLSNLDHFAWIGAFSSGMIESNDFSKLLNANKKQIDKQMKLLWIGCGKKDDLYPLSKGMFNAASANGIKCTWKESDGGHSWFEWRNYISEFLPLLFK